MNTPAPLHPNRIGLTVTTVVFALFCLNAWGQVVMYLGGRASEPQLLILMQVLSGGTAYAAAIGTFRRRPWATGAALAWGLVTASLILSLGSILGLDADERKGLIFGGLSVLLIGSGLALYLRTALRRGETPARPAP